MSGKIKIGDEEIEIVKCVDQRGHSEASRDCWSVDWIWSAVHLDDRTRIHGLDLRNPGAPRMTYGYV